SDQLDELNVRLSDPEVAELMTAVNETWAQAGIIWSVESIVREDARNESLFRAALTDPTVSPISVLTSVLTSENLRLDIWNVFMIRDFGGGLGGVYLGIERLVVSTEIDPLGQRDIGEGMARILAHELGHSLGLFHAPCVAQGNLMAVGCTLGSRTFLDATQITAVRLQAETGRPF
ncbi:MAG: zinc-dependent metalloprotease family protein, partial [Nitrospirales bacterium]